MGEYESFLETVHAEAEEKSEKYLKDIEAAIAEADATAAVNQAAYRGVALMKVQLMSLQDGLKGCQKEVEALFAQGSAVEKETEALTTDLTKVEQENTELSSTNTNLKNDVTAMELQNTEAQTRIQRLESEYEGVKEALATDLGVQDKMNKKIGKAKQMKKQAERDLKDAKELNE